MKIAYLLLVHSNYRQVIRLIQRLDTPETFFVIHVDKKSGNLHSELLSYFKGYPNIIFVKKRYKVYRFGISMIYATIECMKSLVSKKITFDYAILISGHDYPIKSNEEILNFLKKNKEKSYMEYRGGDQCIDDTDPPKEYLRVWKQKIGSFHFRISDRYFRFPQDFNKYVSGRIDRIENILKKLSPRLYYFLKNKADGLKIPKGLSLKRKFPKGFSPYFGSQWWILNRPDTEYVLEFIKRNKSFTRFFKYALLPEESFFHTILANSRRKINIINSDCHYLKWPAVCTSHPITLTEKDFAELEKSDALFARKLDMEMCPGIYDLIDNKLLKIKI